MEDLRGSYQVSKTRYGHSEPTVRWFQVIIYQASDAVFHVIDQKRVRGFHQGFQTRKNG